MDDPTTYRYFSAVLIGMWCLPFVVFFALSLFLARRKGDPARVAVVWIKVLLPFATLFTILATISIASSIALLKLRSYRYRGSGVSRAEYAYISDLNRSTSYASYVSEGVTTALILFTFVELGNGFMYALSGERTTRQRVFRYLSLIPALLVILIPLADTIYEHVAFSRYSEDQINALNKLSLANVILRWIFTLPTVAYAAVAVHSCKAQPSFRGIAIQFLIATILMFARATSTLIQLAVNPIDRLSESPEAAYYISPIFSYLTLGVAVTLLFVIAIRKKKGLWSTRKQLHDNIEAGDQAVQQQGYGEPAGWQPQQLQPVHQVKPSAY
ncbi:hypothetical protein RB596_001234 [Gaeumannomyces avenae]